MRSYLGLVLMVISCGGSGTGASNGVGGAPGDEGALVGTPGRRTGGIGSQPDAGATGDTASTVMDGPSSPMVPDAGASIDMLAGFGADAGTTDTRMTFDNTLDDQPSGAAPGTACRVPDECASGVCWRNYCCARQPDVCGTCDAIGKVVLVPDGYACGAPMCEGKVAVNRACKAGACVARRQDCTAPETRAACCSGSNYTCTSAGECWAPTVGGGGTAPSICFVNVTVPALPISRGSITCPTPGLCVTEVLERFLPTITPCAK